jgi:hypothetical protein
MKNFKECKELGKVWFSYTADNMSYGDINIVTSVPIIL